MDSNTEQVKAFLRAGCTRSALIVALAPHLTKGRVVGIAATVTSGTLLLIRAKIGL